MSFLCLFFIATVNYFIWKIHYLDMHFNAKLFWFLLKLIKSIFPAYLAHSEMVSIAKFHHMHSWLVIVNRYHIYIYVYLYILSKTNNDIRLIQNSKTHKNFRYSRVFIPNLNFSNRYIQNHKPLSPATLQWSTKKIVELRETLTRSFLIFFEMFFCM